MSDDQIFDYDEFFVPQTDPGVELQVPIRGRNVPIRLKRGLTLGDVKAAQSVALIKKFDVKNGLTIEGLDEDKFTLELMYSAILKWPFKKNVGTPEEPKWQDVPVTRDNLKAMLADGAAYIEQYLTGKIKEASETTAPLEKE